MYDSYDIHTKKHYVDARSIQCGFILATMHEQEDDQIVVDEVICYCDTLNDAKRMFFFLNNFDGEITHRSPHVFQIDPNRMKQMSLDTIDLTAY